MTYSLKHNRRPAEKFLAFLLHWNIILGICEMAKQHGRLSFLAVVSDKSVYFAVLFLAATLLITVLQRNVYRPVFWVLVWIPLTGVSLLVMPDIRILLARAAVYYFLNIACLVILFTLVEDYGALLRYLRRYGILALFYAGITWLSRPETEEYSMFFTYATMIPLLVYLITAMKGNGRKRLYFLPFAVILLTNLKYGSRGCIVCCLILLLFHFVVFSNDIQKAKYALIVISAVLLAVLFWDEIIRLLVRLFPSARSIRLLANGLAFYDAHRSDYYGKILSEFSAAPFAFRGLYSDRFLMAESRELEALWGSYAHNFLLEVLYQFGAVGIPLLAFFIRRMFRTVRTAKGSSTDPSVVSLLEVVYAYAIGQLMLSSSYLIAPSFGALAGIMLMVRRMKRKELL